MAQFVRSPAHFPVHILLWERPQVLCLMDLKTCTCTPSILPTSTSSDRESGQGASSKLSSGEKHQSQGDSRKMQTFGLLSCSPFLYRSYFLTSVSLVWAKESQFTGRVTPLGKAHKIYVPPKEHLLNDQQDEKKQHQVTEINRIASL